ncbi:M20 metallopeptidase family protein [Mycoplasma sp. P36-A1]|uniref:M20 metallopeptidase family protein n=1 Tax=Mycoplasma sp. P36-A1 TaxID=3252900 RepID=UPI003C2AAE3D
MDYKHLSKQVEEYVKDLRRKIHQYPELGSHEFKTQELIIKCLEDLNIEYTKINNTSVIANIYGLVDNSKIFALRADMDALPMQEESNYEYKSLVDNVAHTCGHDVHTSMLLGAAKILSENTDQFDGCIRLIFQESEEVGAETAKYAKQAMENVDAIFALHVTSSLEVGEVDCSSGPRFAGADVIHIKWIGESGHSSEPFKARDSLFAAATFVTQADSIISKFINPNESAVLSCGHFNSGDVPNIIPKYAQTDFTFRYFNYDVQKVVFQKINEYAQSVASMYNVEANVDIRVELSPVINDAEIANFATKTFSDIYDISKVKSLPALNGAEDFSEYLLYTKGAIGWLGVRNEDIDAIYPVHHEKFKIDEESMVIGLSWLCAVAVEFLNKK